MDASIAVAHATLQPLLAPVHPLYCPFPLIDLYGAMRLSSVVNWIASGAFGPPASPPKGAKGKRGKGQVAKRARPSALQEVAGIMVVVFGGETFLAMSTNTSPSWLVNPSYALLFGLIHLLQTRTPFIHLLPSKPSFLLEILLATPDAIGRTLLLTRFSVLPLLASTSPKALPPTPASLLLVPFILAVPFASLIFSATSFFTPTPHLSTPDELKPWGWLMVDAWAPVVVPAVFLSLIGPVQGWEFGLRWAEYEAVVVCMVGLSVVFALRAVYNFGGGKEVWGQLVEEEKVKVD
ncbi:hypothetical protein L198_00424 [Cryptococcus wingfieldii CBS 7118]|uniref:Uncharacterized protein n=1 Tax=Cryptococcus wingfieldii CBS 7118 TaxID=1295528 RepID=A0A1E3K6K0_9TREE|nr:hypothetical protein L198_00424 [Cryptococcus wingfieldii CBS 7118]ODO08691.1 hypothetical protein L198_00424 [Cryptococcus wingfieldii CBS 7118]